MVNDWGATLSVKSGGGAAASMSSARVAVCVKELETPVKVVVFSPRAAFAAAAIVTLCGIPGVRLRVDGVAVTPDDSPLMETATDALKPLLAVALIVRFFEDPAVIERLVGEGASVKSGCGPLLPGEEVLPHEVHRRRNRLQIQLSKKLV